MANLLKISINEQFLDLGEAKVSLNYSSGKLQEIETRTGFSSYEITVPATTLNKSLLNIRQRNPAKLYLDNNVINTGFIQVVDRNKVNKTFKLIFFSGNNNWFEIVKEKELTETNLDNDVFLYNPDSVLNPPANVDFLAMNNGIALEAREDNKMYWEEPFPAIKTRRVFEKIFNDAGYNLEGSLLSDSKFNNDYILLRDEGEGVNQSLLSKASKTISLTDSKSGPGDSPFVNTSGIPFTNTTQPIGQLTDEGEEYIDIAPGGLSILSFNTNVKYKIDVSVNNITIDNIKNIYLIVIRQKTGVPTPNSEFQSFLLYSNINKRSSSVTVEDINFGVENTLFIGYRIELENNANWSIDIDASVQFTPMGGVMKPNTLNFPQLLLPDIKQADLIKELSIDYAILFDINESSKTIYVDSFDVLNNNTQITKDWSNKIINGDNETEDYIEITSNYGINNRLTRANNVGDGGFNVNNLFLPGEVDLFESDFDGLTPSQLLGQSFSSSLVNRFEEPKLENVRVGSFAGGNRVIADNNTPILEYLEDPNDNESLLLRMEAKQPAVNVGDLVVIKGGLEVDLTVTFPYPMRVAEIRTSGTGGSISSCFIRLNNTYDDSISYIDNNTTAVAYLLKLKVNEIENVRVLKEEVDGANIQTTNDLTIVQFGLQTSLQNIRIGYFNKILTGTIQDLAVDSLDYNNIINNYYSTIINTLNNNTYLRTEVLLSEVDIRNLRFSIPIKYKNDYYYLDSVEEYDGQRATVNLIKL